MPGALMADGVISLDDRPAIAAVNRANTALDDHEKKTKTVLDRSGREWQVFGEGVVRVSDRGKTSLDRLLQSMEKQAALAGKTGADRMIAERDMLIRKWGEEERAVQAITKAYDKMIAAESGGGGSKWKEFGDQVKNAIQNPLQAAGSAAAGPRRSETPAMSRTRPLIESAPAKGRLGETGRCPGSARSTISTSVSPVSSR